MSRTGRPRRLHLPQVGRKWVVKETGRLITERELVTKYFIQSVISEENGKEYFVEDLELYEKET